MKSGVWCGGCVGLAEHTQHTPTALLSKEFIKEPLFFAVIVGNTETQKKAEDSEKPDARASVI